MSKKVTQKVRDRQVRLSRKRAKKAKKKTRVQLTAKLKLARRKKRRLEKQKAELEAKALDTAETVEPIKVKGRSVGATTLAVDMANHEAQDGQD